MRTKKLAYTLAAVFFVVISAAGVKLFVLDESENLATLGSTVEKHTFIEDELGLQFTYSEPLFEKPLSEADIKDQFVGRLVANEPSILVSVRYEDGLASVATLSNTDPLTLVTNNAVKALPTRYSNFTQKSLQSTKVADKDAKEAVFEYSGENNTPVTQRLTFIDLGGGTVVYIASQSESSSFGRASNYFDEIIGTLSFED